MLKTIYWTHDGISRAEFIERYKHEDPDMITRLEDIEGTLNECYTKYYGGPLCDTCMSHRECVENQEDCESNG